MPLAGGPAVRQTRNRASDYFPVASPDGRRIAFVSDRGGDDDIWVMDSDGSRPRVLTRDRPRAGGPAPLDTAPAWSPDGRRIAFASTRAGHFNLELFTMRPDGTGLRRLTRTGGSDAVLGDDATPAYSPDGARVAFASNRDRNNEIYVMTADGSGQRRLTRSARADDLLPRFSPDGSRIAFASTDRSGASRVTVMAADGSAPRALGPGAEPSWLP